MMEEVYTMPKNEEGMTQSVQATRRHTLQETNWEAISEAGAYVERGSGDLYRFPKEELIAGAAPFIVKVYRGASVQVKGGENSLIADFQAWLLDATHNVDDYR